jgi:chromate transport protein ChrA
MEQTELLQVFRVPWRNTRSFCRCYWYRDRIHGASAGVIGTVALRMLQAVRSMFDERLTRSDISLLAMAAVMTLLRLVLFTFVVTIFVLLLLYPYLYYSGSSF